MDVPRKKYPCWNTGYGCDFGASSVMKNLRHFQDECGFHPVQCFKCREVVRREDFVQHYVQVCSDGGLAHSAVEGAEEKILDRSPLESDTKGSALCTQKLFSVLKNIEQQLKDKDEKLDALNERFDAYVQRQKDKARVSSRILHRVEELGDDVQGIASNVQQLQKNYADLKVAVKISSEALEGLVCQLSNDVGVVSRKQGEVESKLAGIANATSAVLDNAKALGKDVSAIIKNAEAAKEDRSRGVREIRESVDSVSKTACAILQKVNELVEQVPAISRNAESVLEGSSPRMRELKDSIAAVPRPIREQGWMRRVSSSEVVWHIKDVDTLVKNAGGLLEWQYVWSDAFVVAGYTAKLSFGLTRGFDHYLCFAVAFYICPGPNDGFLPWPFRTPVTLSIVHAKDASKNLQTKTTPCVRFREKKHRSGEAAKYGGVLYFRCEEHVFLAGFIERGASCVSVVLDA